MRILEMLSITLLLTALGTTSAAAQQSQTATADAASSSTLFTTLADHESAVDGQRARLGALLASDEVRHAADERGIDIERVESAAAGMSDSEVSAISPLVDSITQEGGGLGTVTIGVGLLIVILLVLILVD